MTVWPQTLVRRALIASTALSLAACSGADAKGSDNPDPNDAPGEVVMSALDRELNPRPAAQNLQRFSADNRDFAFHLLEEISASAPGENVFFSPHSISLALAMTYAGAASETYEQMGEVLRFTLPEHELHESFNHLDLELASRGDADVGAEGGDPPVLKVANATWGLAGFPFHPDFLDVLALNYGAGVRTVDFLSRPEETRQEINHWVEDQTEERIKDLLPEGSIDASTVMVLVNAIYFYAGWLSPFEVVNTAEADFTRADDTTVTAPMMVQDTEAFTHFADDTTVAVSMPYVGGDLAMVAFMPADPEADFAAWETSLSREHFDGIVTGLNPTYTRVSFPKFGFNGDYDLKNRFESMGWTNVSNLERMHAALESDLFISGIFHKSFIAVDEEGTEAAAATAVVVGRDSAIEPVDLKEVHFNRPFYYAVYDHPSDTILFLGRVLDPNVQE